MAAFIELEKIEKRLGGRQILAGLELTVETGETMVILGVSGSGKSVTLRHIVGLMRPDAGRVIVDGEEITKFSESQLRHVREKVAFIFQGGALFDSMTVSENVAFGLLEQRKLTRSEIAVRVSESLARVGLDGSDSAYPSDLSGGMRKRVALARSMALYPRCLLYDEPTAGLDPVTGFRVSELIRSNARESGVTSIVVTHDVPSACHVADRIAFLSEGRITFVGTPDEAWNSHDTGVSAFLNAYEEKA